MTLAEHLSNQLARNAEMLQWHLGDFSDADMFVRPCDGANHTAWQIGHLTSAEASMLNMIKPGTVELPAGFAEKFAKVNAANNDPSTFTTKAEILQTFNKVRQAAIALAKSLTPAELEAKGPEKLQKLAPTVADVLALMPIHATMHLGQIQTIRRKLGRPVLF